MLGIHAPLQTGQHDIHRLSDEARQAKQVRRIGADAWRQIDVPAGPPAEQLATASRDRESTTSRRNSRLRLTT